MAEECCEIRLYMRAWIVRRAGTNNDRNLHGVYRLVLDRVSSKLHISAGEEYIISAANKMWTCAYVLSNGIYPEWPIFAFPSTTQIAKRSIDILEQGSK